VGGSDAIDVASPVGAVSMICVLELLLQELDGRFCIQSALLVLRKLGCLVLEGSLGCLTEALELGDLRLKLSVLRDQLHTLLLGGAEAKQKRMSLVLPTLFRPSIRRSDAALFDRLPSSDTD
jgi:hypothetical protein